MNLSALILTTAFAALGVTAAGCTRTEVEPASETTTQAPLLLDLTASDIAPLLRESSADARITLVNVWATWCAPCVKEFPMIVRLQRTYPESLRVIFISADFPEDRERAEAFLADQGVDWTSYFNTSPDDDLIRSLSSEWTGALPLTQVYAVDGTLRSEWSGEADYEDFENAYRSALD